MSNKAETPEVQEDKFDNACGNDAEQLRRESPVGASDLSTKSRDAENAGHSAVVAAHYNTLEEKGLAERLKSRIFYLRNFNNWMKSMLINDIMNKIKEQKSQGSSLNVLDMGCGKGGDLLKWRRSNISHLVCVDLAATSIEQCQARYNDVLNRSRSQRGFQPVFTAEFIAADCTKVNLRDKYKNSSLQFDLVSCQFAFHYCFESLPQAECMIRNAADCLKPGGYFIGTIPDANEIIQRLRKSNGKSFGNDVYKIEVNFDSSKRIPLFGAKYDFHLEGVVDCPEFLVHFPTLIKLSAKFGLKLILKEKFSEYYERMKGEGRSLLGKMQALETFPPFHDSPLLSKVADDYEHVQSYMQRSTGHRKVGTLSRSEWEAASLYLVFVFQKRDSSSSSGGEKNHENNEKSLKES